jgi:hypothetical protein
MLYVINKNCTGINCVFIISILHFPTARMRTTTSVTVYKTHPLCTHTTTPPSGKEYRPNSHPQRRGRYTNGVVADPSIVHPRSVDIAPDTGRESSVQHLIRKRAQQLKEDRESLKASLERYIQQRTIQKWTPPAHPSYNLFDARLNSFDT